MRVIIQNYTFDASAKTIEFSDYIAAEIVKSNLILVINTTTSDIIYNVASTSLSGSVVDNVLTLTYDTTSMNDSDKLFIAYEDPDAALNVNLATRVSGEDITNDWIRTISEFYAYRITTAATFIIKAAEGRLGVIVCNKPVAGADIEIYNATTATGTPIHKVVSPDEAINPQPFALPIGGGKHNTGIVAKTTGLADWTIYWI